MTTDWLEHESMAPPARELIVCVELGMLQCNLSRMYGGMTVTCSFYRVCMKLHQHYLQFYTTRNYEGYEEDKEEQVDGRLPENDKMTEEQVDGSQLDKNEAMVGVMNKLEHLSDWNAITMTM